MIVLSSSGRTDVLAYTNFAVAASGSVIATPAFLYSLSCFNNHATAVRYIQIFNRTTAPSVGDTPVFSFPIPAQQGFVLEESFFTNNGYFFNTGIAWGISSTAATYTAGLAADQVTTIIYRGQ